MLQCSAGFLHSFSNIAFSKVVPKIAIVGSGPAGFYAAQQLLKVKV